jgi:hypothetical protein
MSVQPWHRGTPERDPAELAEESARRRAEKALEDWARKPMTYNPINNPPGGPQPPVKAVADADRLTPALERAIFNPRRLNTPGRQQAAFLRLVPRCATVAEAASRAGVNRGTLYRWRARDPRFARRWDDAVARQAAEAADNIALEANKVEVQPVFYRGKQIAERRKINTRLLIHVQNRLDCDRRRAEDRAERRDLLMLKAELAERHFKTSQSATPVATPETREMCNEDLGLAAAA